MYKSQFMSLFKHRYVKSLKHPMHVTSMKAAEFHWIILACMMFFTPVVVYTIPPPHAKLYRMC
jgi:hypothetical protein